MRRWWRPVLAVVGLVLAAFFFLVYRQVLDDRAEAELAADGQARSRPRARSSRREQFVARSDPKPGDVGVPYAWSTAATIDPWPEGKNFFPRIFDDVRNAKSSVHILMFGWREGEVGTQLADLLVREDEAGRRGADHRRRRGSKPYGPAEPMFTRLADAGAQIVVNDTLPLGQGRPLPGPPELRLDARTTSAAPTTASST